METNPYIKKIHLYSKDDKHLFEQLKKENFCSVIDLQNNYRSRKLCRKLKLPFAHFSKLNIRKWLLVNLKINKLPDIHVVDRYFITTKMLGELRITNSETLNKVNYEIMI